MTTIIKNWNTDENYWDLNTAIKTVAVFNHLYKTDKSKNKTESSKLMWAIALLIDPNEANPWRNVSPLDKKNLIALDYLNDVNFNWSDSRVLELIDNYKNLCITIAERSLIEFEDKLASRARFISTTEYSLDYYEEDPRTGKEKLFKGTATQLDKMMVDTVKIYDQLKIIKQQLSEEAIDGTNKGGTVESAGESGLL